MTRTRLEHCWVPAVNVNERRDGKQADILLLHYTGMKSAEVSRQWLTCAESAVSCHYLVDEAGEITQMVGEDMRAWHAGEACWRGESDINSRSIGIEIQNLGHNNGYPDFPPEQMAAVTELCRDIIERHDFAPERVLAHSDVAPGRKWDPGEKFDWRRLHDAGIGHWVEPAPLGGGVFLQLGDQGDPVSALQVLLSAYGYNAPVTGDYDEQTRIVVEAFQRHFRPGQVDGVADQSTIETLKHLIDTLPSSPIA
ncbi:MAG: N-acetylmuramoyl-L-alanine amidase [Rhizobiales bacterium]|nr:N-acetylmuramoyl-L-alanine amidase [Hyphomicrobiales bacterium]